MKDGNGEGDDEADDNIAPLKLRIKGLKREKMDLVDLRANE